MFLKCLIFFCSSLVRTVVQNLEISAAFVWMAFSEHSSTHLMVVRSDVCRPTPVNLQKILLLSSAQITKPNPKPKNTPKLQNIRRLFVVSLWIKNRAPPRMRSLSPNTRSPSSVLQNPNLSPLPPSGVARSHPLAFGPSAAELLALHPSLSPSPGTKGLSSLFPDFFRVTLKSTHTRN